jgi:hypothetical protein
MWSARLARALVSALAFAMLLHGGYGVKKLASQRLRPEPS